MKTIHLANTDFEFELAKPEPISIEQSWSRHPLCLQLQFLPILYAEPEEAIAVTAPPDSDFIEYLTGLGLWDKNSLPQFLPLDTFLSFPGISCQSWGYSQRVQKWAKTRRLFYPTPHWEIVQLINSKAFSFAFIPKLEGTALLHHSQELEQWFKAGTGKRVLKTCFGLSGRGHRRIDDATTLESIRAFCEKEWQQKRTIIAEPWLNRFFDFSTQWHLSQRGQIQLVGATAFEVDDYGSYQGTLAGPESLLFDKYQSFLEEHKKAVYPILEKIVALGFFGSVGIDAFLYYGPNKDMHLYPIVEINGRQTMSLAALRFQRRWFPDRIVHLAFADSKEKTPLLPTNLKKGEKDILVSKTLGFSLI